MVRANVIEHAGKSIVFVDFSQAKLGDIGVAIEAAKPLIRTQPLNSVLTLTDATGIAIADVTSNQIAEFMRGNKPFVKAAAVFGVSNIAKAILSTLRIISGRPIAAYDSRDLALRWLTSRD